MEGVIAMFAFISSVLSLIAVIIGFVLFIGAPIGMVLVTGAAFSAIRHDYEWFPGWLYSVCLLGFVVAMPLSGLLVDWGLKVPGSELFAPGSGAYGCGVFAFAAVIILGISYWITRGVYWLRSRRRRVSIKT